MFEEVRGQSGRENVAVGYPPIALSGTTPVISLIRVRPQFHQGPDSCFLPFSKFSTRVGGCDVVSTDPPLASLFGRLLIGSSSSTPEAFALVAVSHSLCSFSDSERVIS